MMHCIHLIIVLDSPLLFTLIRCRAFDMHATSRRLRRIECHMAPAPASPPDDHVRPSATSSPPPPLSCLPRHVVLSPAVRAALQSRSPVVALESTIITHGMSWPANLETALQVEAAALSLNCTPATIAILDGRIHVGLSRAELERLGQLGQSCRKCSTRDLAVVVAEKGNGSTTVAATMRIAHWCGIRVFATGGVGGVHRGVEETGDISADLEELSRTPVAVVCAGVKSILDIARTLEFLETKGVPVLTVSSDPAAPFPAFFSADSGCRSPLVVPTAIECADIIHHQDELGLSNGVLIANPIPATSAAEGRRMEDATQSALREMRERRIHGSAVTPFLLLRIAELTGGESLTANIALILNNVRLASRIAIELRRREDGDTQPPPPSDPSTPPLTVVVVGAVNWDLIGRPAPGTPFILGTSSPGIVERHWGGVGRNIAEALGRLEHRPLLIAPVGEDGEAEQCIRHCAAVGVRPDGFVKLPKHKTSIYLAVMDESNDLFCTITHMDASDAFVPALLPPLPTASTLRLFIVDSNLPSETIARIAEHAALLSVPVLWEPTSIEKSARGHGPFLQGRFALSTPSAAELLAMAERVGWAGAAHSDTKAELKGRDRYLFNHDDEAIRAQAALLLRAVQAPAPTQPGGSRPPASVHLVIKRGSRGVLLASRRMVNQRAATEARGGRSDEEPLVLFTALTTRPLPSIVSSSGAGDTLCGAMAGRLLQSATRVGDDIDELKEAIREGMRAAELTLMSHLSVSPELTRAKLRERAVGSTIDSTGLQSSHSSSAHSVAITPPAC